MAQAPGGRRCLHTAVGSSSVRQWDSLVLLVIELATFTVTWGILTPYMCVVDVYDLWVVSTWRHRLASRRSSLRTPPTVRNRLDHDIADTSSLANSPAAVSHK
jgi:hypothetical protein